jgi:hypothetical protein
LLIRDAAVMFIDDLLDDRQAQAGAARLGGDVGLEDAGNDFGRKTWPMIADRPISAMFCASRADRNKRRIRASCASSALRSRLWMICRNCVVSPQTGGSLGASLA